ncbi:hypothetical protein GTY23_23265 [Streptomyces sp. SID5998]|nr:hypothetical protein [Streptomyces sp. SID5998]
MERTQPDPAGVPPRPQPGSYGAQVLDLTARILAVDPDQPATDPVLRHALDLAGDIVLHQVPAVARHEIIATAELALPDLTGTDRAEAALRLRTAALSLAAGGPARYGRPADQTQGLVRRMLTRMADHLETVRPDEPITAVGRQALIRATTMDPQHTAALQALVPEITDQVVRREFAAQLREIAGAR